MIRISFCKKKIWLGPIEAYLAGPFPRPAQIGSGYDRRLRGIGYRPSDSPRRKLKRPERYAATINDSLGAPAAGTEHLLLPR